MEELLKELIGEKVTYSRVGFGTILLVKVDNDNGVWVWNYWEIWRGEELLATANDESTPMMSVAAQTLLGETVEEVYLNENYNLMMFFSNNLELYIYRNGWGEDDYKIDESWEYSIPHLNKSYTVMRNKEIKIEKYTE